MILNTFVELGLDRLVGGSGHAFINLTRSFLTGKLPLPMKHDRIVLEVLEDVVIDQELIDSIRRLRENGYQLALDDVRRPQDVRPLLDITDIVKVDLMATDRDKLKEHVEEFKRYPIKLLAEKVENLAEFHECKDLGFDLFQGYFLARPHVIKNKRLPGSKVTLLRLLAKVQSSQIEFSDLETMISQDVSLSFKLLRLINSAFLTRGNNIQSLRQALTLLGLQQVTSWVSLLLLSESEDKPRELMTIAMVRARMCELLGQSLYKHESGQDFIVGLFSVLDALLDLPIDEAISSIPLSEAIRNALIHHQGKMGEVLECVIAYENGFWESPALKIFTPDKLRNAYLDAVAWADEIKVLMGGVTKKGGKQ